MPLLTLRQAKAYIHTTSFRCSTAHIAKKTVIHLPFKSNNLKVQAATSKSELIHAASIKFFRSMRNLASQLLASLRLERISLPDISKWRVYCNSS